MADPVEERAPERIWLHADAAVCWCDKIADDDVEYVRADRVGALVDALRACEENLRLIHGAAGPVERGAPMPSHSTFAAWRLAQEALASLPTPSEGGSDG